MFVKGLRNVAVSQVGNRHRSRCGAGAQAQAQALACRSTTTVCALTANARVAQMAFGSSHAAAPALG